MTKSPLLIFMTILLSFLFTDRDIKAQGDYADSPMLPLLWVWWCFLGPFGELILSSCECGLVITHSWSWSQGSHLAQEVMTSYSSPDLTLRAAIGQWLTNTGDWFCVWVTHQSFRWLKLVSSLDHILLELPTPGVSLIFRHHFLRLCL